MKLKFLQRFLSRFCQSATQSLAILCLLALSNFAHANNLHHYLNQVSPDELIPSTDKITFHPENSNIAIAHREGVEIGYIFLNSDFSNSGGYSGKPIDILVGMDIEGIIRGIKMMHHEEPIFLEGIAEQKQLEYLDGLVGFNAITFKTRVEGEPKIISGATVSVLVIYDSITYSAGKVWQVVAPELLKEKLQALGLEAPVKVQSWKQLLRKKAIANLHLTNKQVKQAFKQAKHDKAAKAHAKRGLFIDTYVAQVSIPDIGYLLLGENEWKNLKQRLKPNQHAILVMSSGDYSFKGSGYVRGGLFERFQINQGLNAYRFRDRDHKRLSKVFAEGAPEFTEVSLFIFPADAAFNPSQKWEFSLLAQQDIAAREKSFVKFALPYQLPPRYLIDNSNLSDASRSQRDTNQLRNDSDDKRSELWKRIWQSHIVGIGVLVFSLLLLTAVFFFQMQIVKNPKLLKYIRIGFLTYSLVWLGWFQNAQISVVNIFTFSASLADGFSWQYFLVNPFIFILWFAVAASLLFWGRGPFCGWLCPFGALQELTNKIAKHFGVKQIHVPWAIHERLWTLKYVIFMLLFGLALYDLTLAERLSEVEPFKTSIILNFIRDWPFVLYALILLTIGLFIERFFCRYLCPLGAALAIPGKMRMFDWLKRYSECGTECHLCAKECPVQAIHSDGYINPHECIYCMHCQELYCDKTRCFHFVKRTLRHKKRKQESKQTRIS